MAKINWRKFFIDLLYFVLGSAIYAISVDCFTAPNGIAPGGITGVSTMINHLFGLPIGLISILLNIPIFILGTKKLGFSFLGKTMISTLLVSFFIDLFGFVLPVYSGDKMLASLYGGILAGAGLSLVLVRGSTTGGTDVIAKLINGKWPRFSMGKIILVTDFIVIAGAAVVYRSIENALYAIIAIYVATRIMDGIIYGLDRGKVILVNSRKHREIADRIMNRVSRGVTYLNGQGAYTNADYNIVFCAARGAEAIKIQRIIKEIDSEAFVVTLDASQILGEGFRQL